MRPNRVYTEKPSWFDSKVGVAGAFLWHNDKFLLLKRHHSSPQPLTWSLPAGKMEGAESPAEGAIREIHEETGVALSIEELEHIASVYCDHAGLHYTFHVYFTELDAQPEVVLAPDEHIEYGWFGFDELDSIDLIWGGQGTIAICRQILAERAAPEQGDALIEPSESQ